MGNFVGARVGLVDGIRLGEGDGMDDGLADGIGVVGAAVGVEDGRFVGLHEVHESEKYLALAVGAPKL